MIAAQPLECCAFCGLPLPRPWWTSRRLHPTPAEPHYCCYGCALAHTATTSGAPAGDVRVFLTGLGVAIFLTMNVMVFSMDLWTQDVYAGDEGITSALADPLRDVFRYLCLLLSLPVMWLLGRPLAASAWQNLRRGGPTTDLLMVLGVAAAMIYSMISVIGGHGHVYFEVGCVVLVMVTIGRWLDATGKVQTTAALDALEKLLPEKVRLVRGGQASMVPCESIRAGDSLQVLAGERFGFDGRLLAGSADVDEQVITGESYPVTKGPGELVYAGSVNLDGDLLLEVTAERRAGALQQMIEMVRAARLAKGYHAQLVDRVSAWFLPTVALIAIATFAVHAARSGFEQGLLAGLAVSLIACPCALGLATPMAVWAALGRASQAQVLVRSGEALERLAAVRALALDKTGTLTTGVARVAEFFTDASSDDENSSILHVAATMAVRSNHPFSSAIVDFSQVHGIDIQAESAQQGRVNTLPGRGLTRELPDGRSAWLGNRQLMRENGLTFPSVLLATVVMAESQCRSLTCVGWDGRVRGVFLLSEEIRPDAPSAVARLRQMGLHVCLLTGDHSRRAKVLAEQLEITAQAELLPGEKLDAIVRLREEWGSVAMVGDGINDSPALAAADVGIAMGCGADASRQSAGVCLLGNHLERVPDMIELARKTITILRQNLFWAFFYNVGGIGLAAMGWLNPIWAAAAMVASSLLVIGNSLRLRGTPTMPAESHASEPGDAVSGQQSSAMDEYPDSTVAVSDEAVAAIQEQVA